MAVGISLEAQQAEAILQNGQADLIATGNSVAAGIAKKNPEKKVENKLVLRESPASIGVRTQKRLFDPDCE